MLGDSRSNDSDEVFSGVRFVLFGFDSVSESQYRSELVRRGGIDVGRYDPSCTHVIVSGRTYDDPICVAARGDGKTLVTELWIDDSMDFAMLADATRILYRPVKDLNGVPGSESLYICLTGYQRQERDDIMKMVELMGAHFSKPLIANKVTHLICYKFEGEKYELAKRVNIKLVNHLWLEDCLKAWMILPIDNYKNSGWELEIMEAEARDSEEETEDNSGINPLVQRSIARGPSILRTDASISRGSELSIPAMEVLGSPKDSMANKQSSPIETILMRNKLYSTPCKDSSSSKVSNMHDNDKFPQDLDHQDGGGQAQLSNDCVMEDAFNGGDASNTCDTSCNLNRGGNRLFFDSRTFRTSPNTNATDEKSSALSYFRKTPRQSSEALVNGSHGFSQGTLKETKIKGDFNISPIALKRDRSNLESTDIQIPSSTVGLHHMDGPSNASPQKRKIAVSECGSRSPRQRSKTCSPRSTETVSSAQLKTALINDVPPDRSNKSFADVNNNLSETVTPNTAVRQYGGVKSNTIIYSKKSLKHGQDPVTNTADTAVSSVVGRKAGLLSNALSGKALNEQICISADLPFLGMRTSNVTVCPSDGIAADLPRDVEPRKTVDPNAESSVNYMLGLAIDGKNAFDTTLKKKTAVASKLAAQCDTDNRDIIMHELLHVASTEAKEMQNTKHDQMALSSERDSSTSLSPANPNILKASSSKLTKKVAEKNLSWRSLNTEKTSRGKNAISSDTIVTPTKSVSSSERMKEAGPKKKTDGDKNEEIISPTEVAFKSGEKEETELETTIRNEKNEMAGSFHKDAAMEDRVNGNCCSTSKIGRKNIILNEASDDAEKENQPVEITSLTVNFDNGSAPKADVKYQTKAKQSTKKVNKINSDNIQTGLKAVQFEPVWYILSGHHLQKKEFKQVIRRLRGRFCRDSHQWSYQATHFIVPDPVRRTEKFFAAAAAGRWILKTDYLTASNEAGKFLEEEPFEWYRNGLSEDGAINLEAPRKWRLLRERTGHGALYGMNIIIHGECIAPPLDTLKRVVKVGDGTILATAPPYTRFLKSGVDFAVVSPGMPRIDVWVQEFLRHEIPCVVADYLVEYVCKPGYSLERHVLYKTQAWADRSLTNHLSRLEEIVTDDTVMPSESANDLTCAVCGSRDRGDVMLICGDESGSVGCGIGTHIDCCDPPLECVPEEDWFCQSCTQRVVNKTPPKSLKRRHSSSNRK